MNKTSLFPPLSYSSLKNMVLSKDAQNSVFLDALLCEEDGFTEYCTTEGGESYREKSPSLPSILSDNDVFSDDDVLVSLISKEKGIHFGNLTIDENLKEAREETVLWVLKICARHNLSAPTSVLAVNYFDRFIQSLNFQQDKPWTTQLAAVACLNVAVKMEESQVSRLLDFQVEESKYEFEVKDIKRMELLVLSTLQWRMNPVTPISFFGHIVRKLSLKSHLHCEFIRRCERVLLCVLIDSKVMSDLPSMIAAATMVHVIGEIDPCNAGEYRNQILALLKINEEQVKECYNLVLKILCCHEEDIENGNNSRRKRQSEPRSPDGVIDAFLNNDSSNDSWASSGTEEPVFKKERYQEQPME